MNKKYIDINCDIGEGNINENDLFPYISSCSIACGGHVGDKQSMLQALKLAKTYNVKVGAHPSYPDKENFGRVSLAISYDELKESIRQQISTLDNLMKNNNVSMYHIKPHGALYNDMINNKELSNIFLEAISNYKKTAYLYVPPKSIIEELAIKKGFKIKKEAFADRNYNLDLSLVSRKINDALIKDPKHVLKHIALMVGKNKIKTIEGNTVEIFADTYCIHGDTPSALEILTYLSKELPKQNIYIKK